MLALVQVLQTVPEQPANLVERVVLVATAVQLFLLDHVPALRELAGAPRTEYDDNRALFYAALEQFGVQVPHPRDCSSRAGRRLGGRDRGWTAPPYDGARRIWNRAWDELGRPDNLTGLVVLASDWEDYPECRHVYERDIVAEAERLLKDS